MLDLVPSSVSTIFSSSVRSVPKKVPDEKSEPSHTIPLSTEVAIGESVTWSHPSRTVAFPGTLKPVSVTSSPMGLTEFGPTQLAFAAAAIGARSIRSTRPPASLLRSAGMHGTSLHSNMNELVLFSEQAVMGWFSFRFSVNVDWGGIRWSHWGELNPRPSPYQGDAIPLSHSGSGGGISGLDLTTADLAVKRGCRCNRLKSGISLVGSPAEIA